MDFLDKHGLKKLINASGTMTSLGATRVSQPVCEAMYAVLPHFLSMQSLQKAACQTIAKATGAQAGCMTACAASGIAIAVAASMTGDDFAKIEALPNTKGMKNEVLIQKGHAVNFGGSVTQMIKMAGAECLEIGTATQCGAYQLEGAINENTAAAVFVVSHHTVQSALISLPEFIRVLQPYQIPVIVDAASEYDLRGFIEQGADVVVYSGHKFLGGPTSGIVAGRLDLIKACYYQEKGIGRCMKIGKESIAGAMEALEQWVQRDAKAIKKAEDRRIRYAFEFLNALPGLYAADSPDPTENPIMRLRVHVDETITALSAFDLSQLLMMQDPCIVVRAHHADQGYFELDPCNLVQGEMEHICAVIKRLLETADKPHRSTQNLADLEIESLRLWPDGYSGKKEP